MKIVGMMLVRNESWIIGLALNVALEWCDEIVILDDSSTDNTPDIISEISRSSPGRVYCSRADRADTHRWDEMDLRQRLFDLAKLRSGTHYGIIDADEIPTGPIVPHLRTIVEECKPAQLLSVPMLSPYGNLHTRRIDGDFQPYAGISFVFGASPGLHWSSGKDGYQHHHRQPHGSEFEYPRFHANEGGIMHLQFASIDRLRAKSAYYKAFETIMYPGRMSANKLNLKYDWSLLTDRMQTDEIPSQWWEPHARFLPYLDMDKEAWQLESLRQIVDQHGIEKFQGINFHGLI